MSVLTHVNSKVSYNYQNAGTYQTLAIPAVTNGNTIVAIIELNSGDVITTAPTAWNGTTDVVLTYLTQILVAGSVTWMLYQLDNVTTAPTSIRWKINVSNGNYIDYFEIGAAGGVAPILRLNQLSVPSAGTSFSVPFTTTTSGEFVIAHVTYGSGGTQTPSAPFALVTHGNYGCDSFYNANAGAAGSYNLDFTSQAFQAPWVWLISFSNVTADPTVTTVTSSGVTEGGSLVFTASLSGATSGSTNYTLSVGGTATAGTDYTSPLTSDMCSSGVTVSGSNFVVPSAVSSWTVTIPTTQDALDEDNETVVLTVGGVASTGGSITDDDAPPVVTFTDGVESFGVVTCTATLDAVSGKDVSFQVDTANGTKTAGTHYTAIVTQTMTIPAGSLTAVTTANTL